MSEFLQEAAINQKRALDIINCTGIIDIWKSIGAEINLVGSVKTGLLMNNLDIDFHIYTEPFRLNDSFRAIAMLAQNRQIKKIIYANLLEQEDQCLEWHANYEDEQKDIWQIDMIHILRGSTFDGYFEDVAHRLSEVLTPEYKQIILQIKNSAFKSNQKFPGICIYQAVIEGKIQTYPDFLEYMQQNKPEGIITWKP